MTIFSRTFRQIFFTVAFQVYKLISQIGSYHFLSTASPFLILFHSRNSISPCHLLNISLFGNELIILIASCHDGTFQVDRVKSRLSLDASALLKTKSLCVIMKYINDYVSQFGVSNLELNEILMN